MEPQIEKSFTEAHRQSYDRGKAEGKAGALLMILKHRRLPITHGQQRHILACTELGTLDRWLTRAFSVASVDELFV